MEILLTIGIGMYILWPAFVLPVIAGPVILRFFRDDPLRGPAAAFTLKPLVATPLWLLFLLNLGDPGPGYQTSPVTMIPGIGLTLVILYAYRHLFRTERNIFLLLLGADAIRWLYSFAALRFGALTIYELSVESPPFLIGVILTNAYAVMALMILWLRRKRREASKQAIA